MDGSENCCGKSVSQDSMESRLLRNRMQRSSVYTFRSKYPRSVYGFDYLDWTCNPFRESRNEYHTPVKSAVADPKKVFRPMLPEKETEREEIIQASKGLRTPEPVFHLGHKHFHTDPSQKKRRKAWDTIHHPLDTTYRDSYERLQTDQAQMIYRQNTDRFGLTKRPVAYGIVPCLLSIPPEPVKDTSWSKDFNYMSPTFK